MSYELSHDTIARQVFEKSTLEARTRRKVEKYIRERLEAQQQRDVQLTNDDLDYISPYLSVINLTAEESQFLEEGRKRLVAARRKRLVAMGVVIIVLLGLTLVSIYSRSVANSAKERATAAQDKAVEAQEEAEAAKADADTLRNNTSKTIFKFIIGAKPTLENEGVFNTKEKAFEPLEAPWEELKAYGQSILDPTPKKNDEQKWGYVNSKGIFLIDPIYDRVSEFQGGEAIAVLNGVEYNINVFGETTEIIKTIFEWKPSTKGQSLPPRAIVGGFEFQDRSSRERIDVYIGRASYEGDRYGGKHPGKIKNGEFFIGYGGRAVAINTFEVLVLGNEGQAAWVNPRQVKQYEALGWEKLLGGYNDVAQTEPLFVTRARYEGQLIPGKLFLEKCHFPYQGQERLTPDFEYLMVAKKTVRNPDKTTAASTK